MGLNEQVLHLWLEVLGSSINTIQKWCDNNLVLHLFFLISLAQHVHSKTGITQAAF
jgi:hypothetical protein